MNTLTTASRRSTGRIGGLLRARSSAAMPNPNHAASGVRTTVRHTAHTNAAPDGIWGRRRAPKSAVGKGFVKHQGRRLKYAATPISPKIQPMPR